MRPQYIIMQ